MITVRSTINLAHQSVPEVIPAVQGDTGRSILFSLADFTIPSGATARYFITKPSGLAVYNDAAIDGNTVLVDLTAQSLAEYGDCPGQVRIILGDDIVTSFEFILHVEPFRGIDAIESDTELNIFDQAIEEAVDDARERMEEAAEETIASIPEDYTALSNEVDDLKGALNQDNLIQIVTNGNFADDFNGWNKNFNTVSVSNNELTLTVRNASNCQLYQNGITYKKGHVYLLSLEVKGSVTGNIACYNSDSVFLKIPVTTSYARKTIRFVTFTNNRTDLFFWINHSNIGTSFAVDSVLYFKNIMLFDLTEIFGLGNEPSNDEFVAMFVNDYYSTNIPDTYARTIVSKYEENIFRRKMINRFKKENIIPGVYLGASDGTWNNYQSTWVTSDFIYIGDLEKVMYSYTTRVCFYKADFTFDSIPTNYNSDSIMSADVPSTAKYMRISTANSWIDKTQVGAEVTINYVPYGIYELENYRQKQIIFPVNLFDKNSSDNQSGYINGGVISPSNDYSVSGFIMIDGYEKLTYCSTFQMFFYDAHKSRLANNQPSVQNTRQAQATAPVPSDAKYVRVCWYNPEIDLVQLGVYADKDHYAEYGRETTIPKLVQTEDRPIYVSKSGHGEYTSLLKALYETSEDIIVSDGDFDLVQEYKDYFDDDFFDLSFDRSVAGAFKLGLVIKQRKVKFEAGVRVTFDLTGIDCSNHDGNDRRFSAIWTGPNCVIEGLNLYTVNNWYSIHDDGYYNVGQCENRFINCVLKGSEMVNRNVIGAGTGTWSRTIIDGCYCDNGYTGDPSNIDAQTIRYHNTGNAGAQAAKPEVIIKNTYVNGFIGFYDYGSQTSKGICMVNNCSMGSAIVHGSIGSTVNFEVLEWNNVIRSS